MIEAIMVRETRAMIAELTAQANPDEGRTARQIVEDMLTEPEQDPNSFMARRQAELEAVQALQVGQEVGP